MCDVEPVIDQRFAIRFMNRTTCGMDIDEFSDKKKLIHELKSP